MSKLTLNDSITSFIDNEYKTIWDLILENKTEELKSISAEDGELLPAIVSGLFSDGESKVLNEYDFVSLKENNSLLFKDLIRLILVLDINGEHEELRLQVVDKLFEAIPDVVSKIREESNGYPQRPVNALVWAEGTGFRASFNALIYYYRQKEDADNNTLHFLIMNRTQITLAIMGHYKNLVGPDMLESAQIKEQLGQIDAALSFYKAVEADFKNELGWFIESPETGPSEEDVVTLESLKSALQAIDRLSNTDNYSEVCSQIDEVLSREHTEIPDFDEDEDEE
ncbi:hypothetical protein [Dysgonomonas sp. 511]|uniref:hypothetical protein n=1 Tax=Dysgonomonas sp. 511 TaxID=2302930 RepID=UPI0013D85512|nr:hypothetical protein [Dysgonomonas sp. 511]NDV79197.1 hypothetical protein [Dysgonomonas sp. 511]